MSFDYLATVVSALAPLGLPVAFLRYRAALDHSDPNAQSMYITFFSYNADDDAWAENQAIASTCYVQVDLWARNIDWGSIPDRMISLMLAAGFYSETVQDLYEDDTGIAHKAMRFNYHDEGDTIDD